MRADDTAADEEYAAFARFGGLKPSQLRRVRLEAGPMPAIDRTTTAASSWAAAPSPPATTTRPSSAVQLRVEAELEQLLDTVVARDYPFLGACYGWARWAGIAVAWWTGDTVSRSAQPRWY